ncbi:hypothetical protein COCSUDRAFT_64714 [Coccomyxa subellipsoidea C-169]|uniref:Uncharacterized protein n=1 Tax=Coccomyxa subellipsoidea (strain C-169) TaxID=574566 RepID=I0Z8D4_COCSC|nr:hypothetical protein COCSUDRAFT_64714 [Coccomyxa subellipsoidea C-169]EIE26903.1 hypothetical protein COCSUDRAFT_64714 [Coccomyxa subellipsoidea C-169]|eukprot:XP_005651447.1 hypothetical protein COCSUDRAFT_64714 [Coccomyxa subellipsoidea C-169]
MAESGNSKSWWQRMSSQPAGLNSRDRQKSLDARFSDPTFLTDEPGFPSASQLKPGPTDAPNGTAGPNASGFPTLSKLFGTGATPATPIAPNPAGLRPIKTPHLEPISHPELAFSPSDIGVWEINKARKGQGGFFS